MRLVEESGGNVFMVRSVHSLLKIRLVAFKIWLVGIRLLILNVLESQVGVEAEARLLTQCSVIRTCSIQE